MDADSNDGTVVEALNGETKPDVVKLAQSAIIKQVSNNLHNSSSQPPCNLVPANMAPSLFHYASTKQPGKYEI